MSDGSGEVGTACRGCGAEPRADARFCDGCGARLDLEVSRAEYKQVTVLFADVVGSMDIAAAVGAERLHEIMTELFDRASAVVKRFGGTVDKFTGDGVMAVFGAPVALEDHAIRACRASLELQDEARRLCTVVHVNDGVDLLLRVGLNSGEVIAGEIGSDSASYTSVGVQVGLAQRMESVAPPGGVVLSESTARLVDGVAELGDSESVQIKGARSPVSVRRLVAVGVRGGQRARRMSTLVGRDWEKSTMGAMLNQSLDRKGRVVGLVGPPGIGKSRMTAEVGEIAAIRGVQVFTVQCESHTSAIPFHAAAGLLRDIFAIGGLTDEAARSSVRARMESTDADDLTLLDDLLGIRDAETPLPAIDPVARGRRLTALLNGAAVARTAPAVYVIEDVHWIDEVSEAMLAGFAAIVPQTRALMVVTFRPEYVGALDKLPGSHRIALAPLDESESFVLAAELLGADDSVAALLPQLAERAAGNPFFVEELVRDLAERGILLGVHGSYVCRSHTAEVRVPASLQATIASRIDRLGPVAKRTLNAAAVIGSRFEADLLAGLVDGIAVDELTAAELIDQVTFEAHSQYEFRHPLIRAVAYESQLKADRADLHRRLAAAIEERAGEPSDAHATSVAQHLEAAGDYPAAYNWHMRAAVWAQFRDVKAARKSWQSARDVADQCPDELPTKVAMQIAPRAALCASAFRFSGSIAEADYDELHRLCISVGDDLSLALGMAGLLTILIFHNRFREASRVASECTALFESIHDPSLTLTLSAAAANAKFQAGEVVEGLRLAQRTIDVAKGDLEMNNIIVGSPLAFAIAMRGSNRLALAIAGWRDDLDRALIMAKTVDLTTFIAGVLLKCSGPVQVGALLTDELLLRETAEALELAERCGDDFALDSARLARGVVLANSGNPADRCAGLALLNAYRDACIRHGYATDAVRWVDIENAKERARMGDLDGAIETARVAVEFLYSSGDMTTPGSAVTAMVELLIRRGTEEDIAAAAAAIERLAAVPTDPGFVLHELPLHRMRALLAEAGGDDATYQRHRDRYRDMANEIGFEAHMAWAAAMY